MDRVAIFIDGNNFYHALKTVFGKTHIKFDVLAEMLVHIRPDRRLLRTYYYNGSYDQSTDKDKYQAQQRFFDRLRRAPFLTLRLGRLERRNLDLDSNQRKTIEQSLKLPVPEFTYVEKGVDVQLGSSGRADQETWQACRAGLHKGLSMQPASRRVRYRNSH